MMIETVATSGAGEAGMQKYTNGSSAVATEKFMSGVFERKYAEI
jgi:hypothetical protein